MIKNTTDTPRFAIRGANLCESLLRHTPAQLSRFLSRMEAAGMNTLIIHVAYGFETYGELLEQQCAARGIEPVYYLQTSLLFLGNIDPKWFAKDSYGTVRTPQLCNETRLCVSAHEAREAFRIGARDYFKTLPALHRLRLLFIDSDGYLFCQCPKCAILSPVEQWMILYRIILEEGRKSGKDLAFWYLSYVWRYQLPQEMELFRDVEAVVFDTHQRCRWAALGEEHSLSAYNDLEAQGDQRAATIPLNIYLAERLAEWRAYYHGKLIVFENLMLQGSISCPQPYTPQLLQDLKHFEEIGINGVIYEAFEPGIDSFAQQFETLGRELLCHPTHARSTTPLEEACHQHLRYEVPGRFNYKNQFNVLSYLTTPAFNGLELLNAEGMDRVFITYATLLKQFLQKRSPATCAAVLDHVLAYQERFDWIMISFNLLRAVEPPLTGSTAEEVGFLTADKLWDWMEGQASPRAAADAVIRSVLESLR